MDFIGANVIISRNKISKIQVILTSIKIYFFSYRLFQEIFGCMLIFASIFFQCDRSIENGRCFRCVRINAEESNTFELESIVN